MSGTVTSAVSAQDVYSTLFDVRDLRVLVTGAAGGLGFAIGEVLAQCGARVTLADIDRESVEKAAASIGARSFVCDVSDPDQVQAMVDDVVEAQGGLDVVFANAGLAVAPGFGIEGGQSIDTLERADWDHVMSVNLNGSVFTMSAAAAVMKRQGSGRIIVTSSTAGLVAEPIASYGYVASKTALINVVRQAALDLAAHNVLVNAICPGPFKNTRISGGATLAPSAELETEWSQMIALKRMATPEEIKGLALYLASPASSFVTGAAIVIDGGTTAGRVL